MKKIKLLLSLFAFCLIALALIIAAIFWTIDKNTAVVFHGKGTILEIAHNPKMNIQGVRPLVQIPFYENWMISIKVDNKIGTINLYDKEKATKLKVHDIVNVTYEEHVSSFALSKEITIDSIN